MDFLGLVASEYLCAFENLFSVMKQNFSLHKEESNRKG